MRNLIQFIIKYSNFLLFLGLEIVAFVLLFGQNNYHRSAYLTSTGRFYGSLYAIVDDTGSYFRLNKENEVLTAENARLMEEVQRLENLLEPYRELDTTLLYPDCSRYQYAHKGLRFTPAKVVHADLGRQRNYLTLNKGTRDGVEADFGVVDQRGVVGIVSVANEHFSLVLPLINTKMSLSCRLMGHQVYGPLEWDGINPAFASLENIARHAEVHVGDTVITSGLTTAFPEGVMVGVVDEAVLKETDAYYHIRVRLSTDFSQLDYVQVVCNQQLREMQEIEGY